MPKYTVTLKHPNRPDGDPIEVPPVGVIQNGESVDAEMTKEEADALREAFGVTIKAARGGDEK